MVGEDGGGSLIVLVLHGGLLKILIMITECGCNNGNMFLSHDNIDEHGDYSDNVNVNALILCYCSLKKLFYRKQIQRITNYF